MNDIPKATRVFVLLSTSCNPKTEEITFESFSPFVEKKVNKM